MKLFWLLCAGLLLAGTVEAGDNIPFTGMRCLNGFDEVSCAKPHTSMEECGFNHQGQWCQSYTPIEYTRRNCQQRMREAMRMVTEGMYLSVPRDGKPTQWVLPIPKGKADSWDAVMKDCVQ